MPIDCFVRLYTYLGEYALGICASLRSSQVIKLRSGVLGFAGDVYMLSSESDLSRIEPSPDVPLLHLDVSAGLGAAARHALAQLGLRPALPERVFEEVIFPRHHPDTGSDLDDSLVAGHLLYLQKVLGLSDDHDGAFQSAVREPKLFQRCRETLR
mmetsp:Transcript_12276/g.43286  ORF Transcript_12276/g.43286 Transcript_12276/m.43286 type:complete len:155 (+) Transcript_12276:698-1162(+)